MSRLALLTYKFAFIIVAITATATAVLDLPIRMLLADPVTLSKPKWYAGFLSNLTVLTWGVGAITAIWTSFILRTAQATREWQKFFYFAGIFTTILMLDDLYMFHEEVFPNYLFFPEVTGLEPSEKFVVAAYGLFMAWFFIRYRGLIMKTPKVHLFLALGFMAASVLLDRGIGPKMIPNKPVRLFIEDSSKYLGAVAWSLYFVLAAIQSVLPYIKAPLPSAVQDTEA